MLMHMYTHHGGQRTQLCVVSPIPPVPTEDMSESRKTDTTDASTATLFFYTGPPTKSSWFGNTIIPRCPSD